MSWCLDCHRNPEPHLRPLARGHEHGLEPAARPRRRARASIEEAAAGQAARRLLGVPPMNDDAPNYWRSLGELEATPRVARVPRARVPGGRLRAARGRSSRRTLLQLLGASLSLAGLAACRRPVENIVPYVEAPEEIVPGVPRRYATTMPLGIERLRPLVESHEGRPTKIEGNELHPASARRVERARCRPRSSTSTTPTARRPCCRRGQRLETWADFVAAWKEPGQGATPRAAPGLAVLALPLVLADARAARGRVPQALPAGALGRDLGAGQRRERARRASRGPRAGRCCRCTTSRQAQGDPRARRRPAARRPETIRRTPAASPPAAASRDRKTHEPALGGRERLSITGAMRRPPPAPAERADRRLRGGARGAAARGGPRDRRAGRRRGRRASTPAGSRRWRRTCSPIAGRAGRRRAATSPPAVHAAVARAERRARQRRHDRRATRAGRRAAAVAHAGARRARRRRCAAGEVKTLVVLGGNPAYDAPADLDFAAALAKVDERRPPRLARRRDRGARATGTSRGALPRGLGRRARVRRHAERRPAADRAALRRRRARSSCWASWRAARTSRATTLVRETWRGAAWRAPTSTTRWNRVLHDGLLAGSAPSPARSSTCGPERVPRSRAPRSALAAAAGGLELVFRASPAAPRRPLRQHRLAPGAARRDHQAHLGQRRCC